MQQFVTDKKHSFSGKNPVYDILGIGIGPFNLSLAALLSQVKDVNPIFFEAKPTFNWHEGLLFEDANITVSHLKDLVTLAQPTNPFSFTSFLHQKKRIYRYIINDQKYVRRREFNQYLQWVSQNIDFLRFGTPIVDLKYLGNRFAVTTVNQEVYQAKNIALGCGRVPRVPAMFQSHVGQDIFPAVNIRAQMNALKDKEIAIVGGGQTGAEILLQILSNRENLPKRIHWISSRKNIAPIDDSPYANELYVPSYATYHCRQDKKTREKLMQDNLLTADGITEDILRNIYRLLYDIEVIEGRHIVDYYLSSRVTGVNKGANGYRMQVSNKMTGQSQFIAVEKAVLCLGFEATMPRFIESLMPQMDLEDGKFMLNEDFSVKWAGGGENKIYALNAGRHVFGLAESNFALMAWRSAVIVNSLVERQELETDGFGGSMNWEQGMDCADSLLRSSGF